MRGPYELAVALRYVCSRRRDSFISFVSLVSILGIAVAVAVLITVMSVVNGFEKELEERILGMMSHAEIMSANVEELLPDWQTTRERALTQSFVEGAAPFIKGEGMVYTGQELLPVEVRGILPEYEADVSSLASNMAAGSLGNLLPESFGVVIGTLMAQELDLGVGDKVTLALAEGTVSPVGFLPRQRGLEIVGIFDSGVDEFDRNMAFMHFDDAARLFRTRGRASGLRLTVTDYLNARGLAYDLALFLGDGYLIDHWSRRHEPFFRSIQLSKAILAIILSLVLCVATFNIVSTLVMVVRDKRSDIAILRSIGTSPRSILTIFASQGSLIGVAGVVLGVALGVGLTLSLPDLLGFLESSLGTDLFSGEVYLLSDLPVSIRPAEVIGIALLALALAVIATCFPAVSAARLPPAEALRHED